MRLALGLLTFALAAHASDDVFAMWWPHFQAAVKSKDAKTVASGAAFPMDWENGPTRQIKTRDEFTSRFDFYFTADMKRAVATAKPVHIPDGQYMIAWKARGNEYSLYFKPSSGAFVLNGLSEGPP